MDRVSKKWTRIEAYTDGQRMLVMSHPRLEPLPENHDCDAMGCGTLTHVWATFSVQAIQNVMEGKS